MAAIRSNAGGQLLNQYLVARIFAFDDDQSEARAACVAKGWEAVRRGPAWIAYASERAAKAAAAAVVACPAEAGSTCHICHDASNTGPGSTAGGKLLCFPVKSGYACKPPDQPVPRETTPDARLPTPPTPPNDEQPPRA